MCMEDREENMKINRTFDSGERDRNDWNNRDAVSLYLYSQQARLIRDGKSFSIFSVCYVALFMSIQRHIIFEGSRVTCHRRNVDKI